VAKLNKVMLKKGVPNPNFKGFMVDIPQANWNAMWIMYGSGDPSEYIINKVANVLLPLDSIYGYTHKIINQTKDVWTT